jgi:acetolactate synthase-1/2/3 large subunit
MGFGLPAAIGAKTGCPEATVIDIAGDGSIQMNSQELATAVLNEIPVIVAIINNGYLGMVRQWQELFYNKRYSHTHLRRGESPDFVRLAEAYGAVGMRVTRPSEVEPTLVKALRAKKPVMIDFMVEQEENVFPMVAPGASLDEMIGG